MPFNVATDASTVKLNLQQSKNWQVTLGGNRTLSVVNANKGDELKLVVIQDSTAGRTLTWPSNFSWKAGAAPTLTTVSGGVDTFHFVYNGSTWRDVEGSPNRLPVRLLAAGLAAIAVIGTGGAMVGMRLNLSQGGGEGVGNLPNALEIRSKSGAELLTLVDGSGSVLVGSGLLAVGSVNTRGTDAPFRVLNNGSTNIRNTLSGATLHASSELRGSGTLAIEGNTVLGGTLTVNQANSIWSVQAGANTACNTTCTSACVFGVNTAATEADIVACSDGTADECLCAGAS